MAAKFQWQRDLLLLQNKYMNAYFQEVAGKVGMEIVLKAFKEKYPGNYHLDWRYDPEVGRLVLRPVFDLDHEATFWKLKYSNL